MLGELLQLRASARGFEERRGRDRESAHGLRFETVSACAPTAERERGRRLPRRPARAVPTELAHRLGAARALAGAVPAAAASERPAASISYAPRASAGRAEAGFTPSDAMRSSDGMSQSILNTIPSLCVPPAGVVP